MKQRISVEDLQQLTNKEQIKIATMFGQYGNCCNTGGETINLGKLRERITIGHMIEILKNDDNNGFSESGQYPLIIQDERSYVSIRYRTETSFHKELCDALWSAVKSIL